MKYPFVRIAAASPKLEVANCQYNANEIKMILTDAANQGVNILTFPELSLTGYSCGDLFFQAMLLESAYEALIDIARHSKGLGLFTALGVPLKHNHKIFNCAVAIFEGQILGAVPKTYLPGNCEFYEKRWFNPADDAEESSIEICGEIIPFGTNIIFKADRDIKIAIEICEDLWSVIPPSSYHALQGANIILNLSASNELTGKSDYRRDLVKNQSARIYGAYCYAGAGPDESTTDVVYGGHCIICENGKVLAEKLPFEDSSPLIKCDIDAELLEMERLNNKNFTSYAETPRYQTIPFSLTSNLCDTLRYIDPKPFIPSNPDSRDKRCQEIFSIQTAGFRKRMTFSKAKTAVIGISGGLDSTLALLAIVKAFDQSGLSRDKIIGITMPGFGTTDRTYTNAVALIRSLGVTFKEIPIDKACLQHFSDIGHDPEIHDITYENSQARERTQILMDISNKENGIVVGTGDLSEIALGWSTYNGDHMSMYAINSGIPKTLIRSLVHWVASSGQVSKEAATILADIIDTPVSPELLPPAANGEIQQKTEELVGPYELHDFFLYYMVRYGFDPKRILTLALIAFKDLYNKSEILKWLKVFYRRFFTQQFKRSCMPDGPKVGSVALSPRGDWRMPSDASSDCWLRILDEISKD